MRRGRVRRHACATDAERKAWKAAGARKALAALHEMGDGMMAAPDMREALLEVLGVRLADYDGGGSADDLCVSLSPLEPRPARSRRLARCAHAGMGRMAHVQGSSEGAVRQEDGPRQLPGRWVGAGGRRAVARSGNGRAITAGTCGLNRVVRCGVSAHRRRMRGSGGGVAAAVAGEARSRARLHAAGGTPSSVSPPHASRVRTVGRDVLSPSVRRALPQRAWHDGSRVRDRR